MRSLNPEDKVYISLVQTDAIGIGAWTKPGRGRIPYAWQVSMSWSWICPGHASVFLEAPPPTITSSGDCPARLYVSEADPAGCDSPASWPRAGPSDGVPSTSG